MALARLSPVWILAHSSPARSEIPELADGRTRCRHWRPAFAALSVPISRNDGPEPAARLYREVKSHLDAARPDAIVVIANDHFNTFFMNNFPTFAIGVADASYGPNDQTKMPHYDFAVQSALASHLRNVGIEGRFRLCR